MHDEDVVAVEAGEAIGVVLRSRETPEPAVALVLEVGHVRAGRVGPAGGRHLPAQGDPGPRALLPDLLAQDALDLTGSQGAAGPWEQRIRSEPDPVQATN